MGLLRRLAGIALEDFGLRRPHPVVAQTPVAVAVEVAAPAEVDVDTAASPTSGIIWHGPARRGPELQRFVDHLESVRA